MRRFTLPNLFLTVDGDDDNLEQIYPGLYDEADQIKPTRRTVSRLVEEEEETEYERPSPASSPVSPRRWRAPFEQVNLGGSSKGCLLASDFGIADEGSKSVSLTDLQERGKGHASNKTSPDVGACGALGECPYCGGCQDNCLQSLGVCPVDGSRSPMATSAKAQKMSSFFEKSLNLAVVKGSSMRDLSQQGRRSPHRRVEEDRYPFPNTITNRSQRSHSLASPGAIDQVARFRRMHDRRPDALFVRLKTTDPVAPLHKEVQDLSLNISPPPSPTPLRASSPLPPLGSSPIEENEEESNN